MCETSHDGRLVSMTGPRGYFNFTGWSLHYSLSLQVLTAWRVRCPWIACACAGGGSYSESFVGSTIFVSGRSPSARWSVRCSGGAQRQRYGIAAIACTWLTVPRTHELVLLRQQRSYSRASRRVLQRLRRAASEHVPHAQLVSRIVLAARARAERCCEHPRSGSSVTCTALTLRELGRHPEKFLAL